MECAAGQALPAPGKPPHKSKRPCAACCKRRGRCFAFCEKVEIQEKMLPCAGLRHGAVRLRRPLRPAGERGGCEL